MQDEHRQRGSDLGWNRRGSEPDLGRACVGGIRPRLIPRAEIDALAAELLARHGPGAEEVASAEEEQAWRNSRPFEQGKWRRVRKRIERLEKFAKK